MMTTHDDGAPDTAPLEKLAAELGARGYDVTLIVAAGRRAALAVRNPAAPMLTEDILADAEWFWWPWADRIAAVTEVAAAAEQVARVLAATGDGRS
jgi:hypothetical protein